MFQVGLALMEQPSQFVFIHIVEWCKWIELAALDVVVHAHLCNFSSSVFRWQTVRDLPALSSIACRLLSALHNLFTGFLVFRSIILCIQILAQAPREMN